jgi:glutamate decarboxylase
MAKVRLPIPAQGGSEAARAKVTGRYNSMVTERITRALVARGFMIDFAPGLEGREAEGKFVRVVVNVQTVSEKVERLVKEIAELGMQVRDQLRQEYRERWGGDVKDGVEGLVVRRKSPAERGHGPVVRQCHS